MDFSRVLSVILLISVFARVSDASHGARLRVLLAEGTGGSTTNPQKVTPPIAVPPPVTVPSEPNQHLPPKQVESPADADKAKLKTPNTAPPPPSPLRASTPPKLVPPSGPETKAPPQGPKSGGDDKMGEGSKGGEVPPPPPGSGGDRNTRKEVCDTSAMKMCHAEDLVACLRHPGNGKDKDFDLLIQNAGENSLTTKIIMPASIKVGENEKKLNLSKHSNQKINFQADATKGLKIVLNAGKGNCILEIDPSISQIAPSVSDWNRFQQLPAFASQLTPMYGAYFLFVMMVIAGGTWACCKFRRRGRRTDAGIPYQQLEMGMQPQADSAVVETSTTDGWDQGWDDDWDDEEAAPVERPPDNHPTGSHSSNGLTSKSTDKNGWDDNWDD